MTSQTSPLSSTNPQRVVLIGAGGLIGRAIHEQLDSDPTPYEVVGVSRRTRPGLDLEDRRSIARTLESLAPFDHVVVAAGEAEFVPVEALSESSLRLGIESKLLGQVGVALAALALLRAEGSITLTSGALSHSPTRGSTPAALVNGAIDAFVRAVAFEVADGRRINAVSPGWITETLRRFGMDPAVGTTAAAVAKMYVRALQSDLHGSVIEAVHARPPAEDAATHATSASNELGPHRVVVRQSAPVLDTALARRGEVADHVVDVL